MSIEQEIGNLRDTQSQKQDQQFRNYTGKHQLLDRAECWEQHRDRKQQ